MSRSFRMTISKDAGSKIRKSCQLIPDVEWSGVLFFKAFGSFEDNSLHILVIDMLPMDIGTSTYTEFMISPDVPAYMLDHPELMEADVHRGLIHSHNRMETFFSGTDTKTLEEFGVDMPHFVSLIVNNSGNYTAAITRKVTIQSRKYRYLSFAGSNITAESNENNDETIIEYFNLDITIEGSSNYSELENRFLELKNQEKGRTFYQASLNVPFKDSSKKFVFGGTEPVYHDRNLSSEVGKIEPMHEEELIDYDKVVIDPEIINSLVRQLLTASVILPNGSKIDIHKWANSMNSLFKNRFGDLEVFQEFAANYVDFLLSTTIDEDALKELDNDDSSLMAVLAYWLVKALEKLPSNEWIKHYILLLTDYII